MHLCSNRSIDCDVVFGLLAGVRVRFSVRREEGRDGSCHRGKRVRKNYVDETLGSSERL